MQHRQVQVGQTAAHEVLDQVAHQHLTHARAGAMRVHGQAPQAATVFGVIERLAVVQAHDATDHRAAIFILGQPVHRPALVARRQQLGLNREHAACLVQGVDGLPVAAALCTADTETAKHPLRLAVVGEPQP
ncbi:hypothetical protein D3C73_1372830 [compost metagenome]